MKVKKYVIKSRYEYYGESGKEFTKWFVFDNNPVSEEEANEKIKIYKDRYAYIDKKTHLKHEYMIYPFSDYTKDQKRLQKEIEMGKKRDEEYFKSDEWKELKHKKYIARKERKKHQEEYKKMMEELRDD